MRGKHLRFTLVFCSVLALGNLPAQQAAAPPAAPENDSLLLITKTLQAPLRFTATELKAMPHTTVTIHNSHTNADETYSGVQLADLLAKVGAPLGGDLRGKALANYVVATGSDGYKAVLALAEVDPSFHPGEVLVADTMNGKPLDAHSGPFKLVVTEDKRPARSVRNLVSIELEAVP
ncbi:MAG TPA: molybdopterin-dependent oxidoreductase [Terriglobales bacterium]|nr:molybdopterin-dependent oxidoreductase [Terriglobales bacterium]